MPMRALQGGFANVYLVEGGDGARYALKVLPKCHFTKPHHREKVVRESALNRRMRHPNVVRCYSSFEDAHNMYLMLEYCQHDVSAVDGPPRHLSS